MVTSQVGSPAPSTNGRHPHPPKAEPQTLHDIVEIRQQAVDKMDAHLRQMADPAWQAAQRARATHKRDAAKHEVDILRAAEAHAS